MSAVRVRVVARLDLRNRSLNRFMAASLAIHIAFAAGLVVVSARQRAPRINPDAIAVTLTGGVPASQTRVQQAAPVTPPKPVEKPASEEATIEPNPVKVTKKPPPEKPKPAEPVAVPPVTSEDEGSGSAAAGPAVGDAESSVASLELGDVEFAWYGTSVTAALQSHYTPPMLANVRRTLLVVVSFEILRDGSVRNIRIETPSGIPSMDRSALRAVTDAAPLPALPAGLGSDTLPARFEFRWYPGAE